MLLKVVHDRQASIDEAKEASHVVGKTLLKFRKDVEEIRNFKNDFSSEAWDRFSQLFVKDIDAQIQSYQVRAFFSGIMSRERVWITWPGNFWRIFLTGACVPFRGRVCPFTRGTCVTFFRPRAGTISLRETRGKVHFFSPLSFQSCCWATRLGVRARGHRDR